jgi:hypothetical protein
MHRLHRYVCLAVVLVAAGCAAQGTSHVATPPPRPLRQYQTVMVRISSTVAAAGDVISQLEQLIIRQLQEQHLFTHVSAPAAHQAFDLTLAVRITGLRRVGVEDRLQSGPLAGRGILEADVTLIEGKSQQTIAQATVVGKTSVDLLFSGTTTQAIRRAAEQVVAFVVQYY